MLHAKCNCSWSKPYTNKGYSRKMAASSSHRWWDANTSRLWDRLAHWLQLPSSFSSTEDHSGQWEWTLWYADGLRLELRGRRWASVKHVSRSLSQGTWSAISHPKGLWMLTSVSRVMKTRLIHKRISDSSVILKRIFSKMRMVMDGCLYHLCTTWTAKWLFPVCNV